jgi:MATE family multidrug resistance protein
MSNIPDEQDGRGVWMPEFLKQITSTWTSDQLQDPKSITNETASLLPKPNDNDDPVEGQIFNVEDDDRPAIQRITSEFWVLLKGAVPVILAYILQNSLQTLSVLIVGRLSPEALSVAAFCYMFAMATAWLIGMGLFPPKMSPR